MNLAAGDAPRGQARRDRDADPGAGADPDRQPAGRCLPSLRGAGRRAVAPARLRGELHSRRGYTRRQRPAAPHQRGGPLRERRTGSVRAFQRAHRRRARGPGLDRRPVGRRGSRRARVWPRHLRHEGRARGRDRGRGGACWRAACACRGRSRSRARSTRNWAAMAGSPISRGRASSPRRGSTT